MKISRLELLLILWHLLSKQSVAVIQTGPFTPQAVDDWLISRCGESGSAIWAFEGALYDPLDGRTICLVEGIELVRRLPNNRTRTDSTVLSQLQIDQLDESGSTILSRKLFCYPSPESPRRLLHSIKLRHNSPLRTIPVHQAVALYDTATTYFGRRNGTELVVHTEFPNGKCYWSTTTSHPKKDTDTTTTSKTTNGPTNDYHQQSLDFTVYTKKRRSELPELSNETSWSDSNIVLAPKRSRLIQFGAAPKQDQQGRFGARETYSYSFQQSSSSSKTTTMTPRWQFWNNPNKNHHPPLNCHLKYTRYGEGPPWYVTGKYCQLELQGRRVNSVADLPPLAASVAAKYAGFLNVASPVINAKQAIQWFREDSLCSSDHHNNEEEILDGSKLHRSAYHARKQGKKIWQRLRQASTHTTTTTTTTGSADR